MSNVHGLNSLRDNNPPPGRGGMPPQGPPGGEGGSGGGGGGFFSSMFGGGGGGHEDHKKVKEMNSDSEFQRELSAAGNRLVVVDFTATWCGPCKMIAPIFYQLSERYPHVLFLKVDIDKLQATARQLNISGVPAFHFYVKNKKIDEIVGADPNKLQQTVQRHASTYSVADSDGDTSRGQVLGGGQTLGGGGHRTGDGQRLGGGALAGAHPLAAGQPADRSAPSTSVVTTSTVATTSAPASFVADPIMVKKLTDILPSPSDMGFPEQRAVKALSVVNNTSVQAAMDWIFEHMDDADIDDAPIATGSSASPSPATTATGTDADTSQTNPSLAAAAAPAPATVHNALCDVCEQQIVGIRYKCINRPNYDLCSACKQKGHAPDLEFQAHTEDIVNPSLTAEERAHQIALLNQRIADIRVKKAADEEAREREREVSRRREGQATVEAKKKWEETQSKREDEKLKREKEEEKRARERVRQKIEQDKLERAAKNRKGAAAPTAQPTAMPQPQPTQPVQSTAKTYTDAVVQVRLTDGSTIKGTFQPTDTMQKVFSHVESNRTDGRGSFSLMTTFPRKVYNKGDQTTLMDAGLVPNGTLVLTKM